MRDLFSESEWLMLADDYGFTSQDLRVAKAVFDDLNPDEIAADVGISPEAASASLDHLFSKTGTTSTMSFALGLYARLRTLLGKREPDSSEGR